MFQKELNTKVQRFQIYWVLSTTHLFAGFCTIWLIYEWL